MEKNKQEVKNIKKGCIDFYYSLRLETKLKYSQLCESITNKVDATITEYNIKAEACLRDEIEKSISKLNLEEFKNIKLNTNHEHKKNEKTLDSETFSNAVKEIKLETTDNGLKIIPVMDLEKELEEIKGESESVYEFCSKIYGHAFVDNCNRINLPCLKVELINNEIVFVRAMLYIFKNGMMVLRISLPIQNVEITPLFEKESDKYIKKIIDEYNVGIDNCENDMEEIKRAYFSYIKSSNKKIVNMVYTQITLENIILVDYDEMPEQVKNLNQETIEDLYRISVAPIIKRKSDDLFIDKAREYINKNSQTFDVVKYITSSMGRCVSIIDKNALEVLEDEQIEEDTYNYLINTIRINIEFALIIILLKKINSGYAFFKKKENSNNIHKIQEEYLYNNIFIIQLQESCYGSVKDQIAFLEERLAYYLNTKDTNEKMKAIDAIITRNRERKNLKFQNYLSIGGVLITIIFGLPAIYETGTILKNCLFPRTDIPVITTENGSIVIWLLLVMYVLIKFLVNRFKN